VSALPPQRRWYDQDPAICRALGQLRAATDGYQAQVALNIIKVILEHELENEGQLDADSLEASATRYMAQAQAQPGRRWYDTSQALQSALNLLRDCPPDLQKSILPAVAQLIEESLARHKNEA
jgi:hypothetical protein